MTIKFKELREDSVEKLSHSVPKAKEVHGLPTHSSKAAEEKPEKLGSDPKSKGTPSDKLPTHSSDAAEEVPDDEKKKAKKKVDPKHDSIAIAKKAAGDGVYAEEKEEEKDKEKEDEEELEAADEAKKKEYEEYDEDEEEMEEELDLDSDDEDEDEEDEKNMKEHVEALTSGDEFSEEFKSKAATLLEAAVNDRVSRKKAKLIEKAKKLIDHKVQEQLDTIVEQIDSYFSYVVEEYMEENRIAIDKGLRTEITENFIDGLKNLFGEHKLNLPEEEESLVVQQQEEINSLKTEVASLIDKNVEFKQKFIGIQKEEAISKFTEDLADSESDKFRELVQNIHFESAEQFDEKLKVIKESYFPKNRQETNNEEETTLIEEGGIQEPEKKAPKSEYDNVSDTYAAYISRDVKRYN